MKKSDESHDTARVWYVSGRYRHYNVSGAFDYVIMQEECVDELYWASVIAATGHRWYAPLANTVAPELSGVVSGESIMRMDLEQLKDMRPNYDCIFMRPGWRANNTTPESRGARLEFDLARERGLFGVEPVGNTRWDQTRCAITYLDRYPICNGAMLRVTDANEVITKLMCNGMFEHFEGAPRVTNPR